MTYEDAMNRYGSDKPDTRFGLELTELSHIVGNSDFKVFAQAVKNGGIVKGLNVKGLLRKCPVRKSTSWPILQRFTVQRVWHGFV